MGYHDKTIDDLYPKKLIKNEHIFIEFVNSLQNDRELFLKGILHSEIQFLSNIHKLRDYIPQIQDFLIKEKVEKFVKSVITSKNYKITINSLEQKRLEREKQEIAQKKRLKILEEERRIKREEQEIAKKKRLKALFKKLEEYFNFQGFIHSTDFENFIKIMKDNKIFCRKYLEDNNLVVDDIALREVIDNTSDRIKNYVRFYWRTKTPTNYRNEGIKPKSVLVDNNKAHSPNPVIFVFDYKIALNTNVRFTDKNAGAYSSSFDCEPNQKYNFNYIFHDSSLLGYDETERKSIIQSRCAEFLYPHELSLDYVKKIVFRNQADYDRAVLRFGNDNRFCIDESQFINHWLKVKTYELKIQNNIIYLKINFNFGKELMRFNLNDFNHKICLLNKFEKEVKRIDIINQYNNEINCKIANNIEYSELCYYIDDIECIRVKLND